MEGKSRRDFLKAFSLLAGSSLYISSLPWIKTLQAQDFESGKTNDKVKLGIIGPGSRGRLLMLHLQQIPGVEISAICDTYQPNYDLAIEMTNGKAKGFKDYRKMLDMRELDGVVIATPLYLHAQMTVDALQAGKHVFCEKAMAMTVEDCYRMYKTHQETGKILQIGHQRIFNVKYIKGIEKIKNGELGKVTQIRAYWHRNNDWRRPVPSPELERFINWRLYRDYSCGLMTELASHQIQVANWVLGELPESVAGFGSINYWNDGREVYDNVNLVFNYPGGVKLVYDSMISNAHYGLEEQVLCSEGTMELESGKFYIENPPPAPGIIQLLNHLEHQIFDNVPLGGASWVPDDPNKDKGNYIMNKVIDSDGTGPQMEAFVNSVREGKPIKGMAEEGYNSSVPTLMGYNAILGEKIVKWPDEYRI